MFIEEKKDKIKNIIDISQQKSLPQEAPANLGVPVDTL